ncbi:hypothetical protein LCGC14_2039590 [marine sediment metagenome]|uniref:Uncharacterized protein n=1 Tax=marine sediment metagenome TaxID=412755 RepID=A0A0F9H5Q7_9ZZZZ
MNNKLINSIEGIKRIKEHAEEILVRIKREKWGAVSIADMTALEFIDVLIMWIEQKRETP